MRIEEYQDAINTLMNSDPWFNPHLGPNTASESSSRRAHAVISVPVLAVKTYKRKRAPRGGPTY